MITVSLSFNLLVKLGLSTNIPIYYMVRWSSGKSVCSDWFLLRQDLPYHKRCIFASESWQIQKRMARVPYIEDTTRWREDMNLSGKNNISGVSEANE